MDMQNVGDLQSRLTTHPDPGFALILQDAISHAINNKGLKQEDALTGTNLEKVRQSLYDLNSASRKDPEADPTLSGLMVLMSVMAGTGTGNPIEDALQYVERLQREVS